MKKFIFLIFILFVFFICESNVNSITEILNNFDNSEIEFLCTEKRENLPFLKNGNTYIYKQKINNFEDVKNINFSNCYGITIKLENNNANNILNKIKLVKKEVLENKINYYGFLTGMPFSNIIDDKLVNVEISVGENIIIGSPIILSSY